MVGLMTEEESIQKKRTLAEWDKAYAKANDPNQKEMTEEEYKRYKYGQLVTGRFGMVKDKLLLAFAPAPQQKGKKGKQPDEMKERFDYISNPFGKQ